MKTNSGALTGIFIGTLFLLIGISLSIWAPNFSGFFDRGLSEPVLPAWVILIGLAFVNYIYAGLSVFIQSKIHPTKKAGSEDQEQNLP